VKYLLKEGLKGIWHNRGMSLASVGVLACCLLLTGVAVLFSRNLSAVVEKAGANNTIMVFLAYDLSEENVQKVGKELKKIGNIYDVEFYSKEKGIKEFSEALGDLQSEFQGSDNPLPDAYKIKLRDLAQYDSTIKTVEKIKGIQKVSDRSGIAKTITDISRMVGTMGIWIIFILGLISVFIVSATIGATIHSRRFEISIMKSVGATDTFVRIPFIVEGAVIGITAGLISSFLIKFLYEGMLKIFQIQYVSNVEVIRFTSVIGYVFSAMIFTGTLLGVSGAVVSLGKYLKREGNELLGW